MPTAPGEAEQIEEKNAVEDQPRRAEFNQQCKVSVVYVEGAEVITGHATGKLGVHTPGGPTCERALAEHRPSSFVNGHTSRHRTAFSGAVPKSGLQRMVTEADRQPSQ